MQCRSVRHSAPILVAALVVLFAVSEVGTPAATVPAPDTDSPSKLVRAVAQSLLSEISAHRAEYQSDPGKLDVLVRAVLLPRFDSELAARQVLGRHWKDASVEQR